MKKLLAGCVCALACVVSADTYHWTGAVDGRWTNPDNWQEGTVPGRYKDADGNTVGKICDVAVFGDALTGNKVTTIDFTNVYSISNLITEGTHQYTYGTAADQSVPIEPYGTFSAAETAATPAAVIQAKLCLGVELMHTKWGGETMTIRNNSTQEFVLGEWYNGETSPNRPEGASGGQPGLLFSGSGDIRLSKKNIAYMFVHVAMTGTLIIDAPTKPRAFNIDALSGVGPQRVEITANGSLYPGECSNYFWANRPTIFFGEGPFKFGANSSKAAESSFYTQITFYCPVMNEFIGGEPAEGIPSFFFTWGGGTLTTMGENTMRGLAYIQQGGILTADAFGCRGTYGDMGDMDYLFAGNGTLRHTGGDDTMDRFITLMNTTDDKAGGVQLEQAGTGAWTVTSPVALKEGFTSGTLTLKGNVATPATFSGTIDSAISILKSDGGDWTFTPQNAYTGAISVSGGTLKLGKSLNLSALTAASGSTDVCVAEGCTIEIGTLTATADKKIDFILEGLGTRVKIGGGTAGTSLAGVTINGHPAVLDENLNLIMAETDANIWKDPVSGSWYDATKWLLNAEPNPERDIFIDASGGDYTVTFDEGEVTTTNLVLKNRGAGTVTLLVTNGAALSVRGHTTHDAVFRVGPNAKVDVVDATVKLINQGDAVGGSIGTSALSFDRSDISVRGTSEFIMRGIIKDEYTGSDPDAYFKVRNLDTTFSFGTGTVTFDDEAVFKTVRPADNKTVYVNEVGPTRDGETAKISFKGNSRMDAPSWMLTLRGNRGRSVMEFDTGYTGEMTGWNCNHIGTGTGVGELIIKRGKLKNNGWDYLWVGTPQNDGSTGSMLFSTGRVVIAEGGQLTVQGRSPSDTQFQGVQFGHGTALTGARGTSYAYGEMLLAGTYRQSRGLFLVGSGANGHGLVRQTGGLAAVVENTTEEEYTETHDKHVVRGEVAVGVFGGTGRYELEDGVFNTAHNVFIGGALTNDLRRYHKNYATLDKYHDAQGTLAISGGSFNTTTNIVLGRDGMGWIELSGTGMVSAASIIVSHTDGQAASGIRFTADAARRCGRIAPATKLVFQPGAVVTVDVTEMAAQAQPRRIVVWDLDTAPEGLANLDLDVVGNENLRTPNGLALSSDGKTLAWNVTAGTVLILR